MKPTLFLVHGMGNHTQLSFKKDVSDSLLAGLSYYNLSYYQGKDIDDIFDIEVFAYDDIFNAYLQELKNEYSDIAQAALNLPQFQGVNKAIDLKDKIAPISDKILFLTHWLDVVLYRFTELGEAIRNKYIAKLSQVIVQKGAHNVHIIAHSLGTSVTLDSLSILYDKDLNIDIEDAKLNPITNRLGSVTYLANVSRILENVCPVYQTVVNPSTIGCAQRVFNINHYYDPFTKVAPYEPSTSSGSVWRRLDSVNESLTELVTTMPHNVANYLKNPIVNKLLFECYLNTFDFSDNYEKAVNNFRRDNKLVGLTQDIKDALENIKGNRSGLDAWVDLSKALQAGYKYIKQ